MGYLNVRIEEEREERGGRRRRVDLKRKEDWEERIMEEREEKIEKVGTESERIERGIGKEGI